MEIYRFREMLGDPQVNGDMERDWRGFETNFGGRLPEDYKRFISAYGPGCVNDQLYIFHPRAAGGEQGLRLGLLWEQAAYSYGELMRNAPELYPYPVYPARGGCLPVARSTSGNHVLLLPPGGESREWQVVVDMGEWVSLEMGFTDFLWAALREELLVPIIDGPPAFERIGDVEPY